MLGGEEVVLELWVEDGRVGGAESLVEPVSAAAAGLGFLAGGEPVLGQVRHFSTIQAASPAGESFNP